MTISGSLSNAISGLTAAARASEVVSANVANAMTDGYGRREVDLSARSLAGTGSGVRVDGVTRLVDPRVIADRQQADAELGHAATRLKFLSQMEAAIGTSDDPQSLNGRIADLDARLVEAASRPDSEPRLTALLQAATDLSDRIGGVSDVIQSLRVDADQAISRDVETLNDALVKISDLNADIHFQRSAGRDASALMDQRQQMLDSISSIIPIRTVARDRDQIAIFSNGGLVLLDGNPARLEFTPVGLIVPEMTLQSGALSGLSLNGKPVQVSAGPGPIAGGSLAASFEVRDSLAVEAQTRLDAVARNLVERFQDPAVDLTLLAGDAGIFTDNGAAFLAANEIGLSARLEVNAALDPAQGGAVWRFRDGINAAAQGEIGQADGLRRLIDAMSDKQIPASGGFIGAARPFSGLGTDFLSMIGTSRQNAEGDQSYALSKQATLKEQELRLGVDTDQELQSLLLIENAYAANARIIQTVDGMINALLEL